MTVKLTSASRMSDDDYAGVLETLGDKLRLVVNAVGSRYSLQECREIDGETVWVGRSYSTMATLLAKYRGNVAEVRLACERWPDDPAQARPDLQEARAEIVEAFEQNDWRRQDYGRVVAQSTQLRVIVEPDGKHYRLQWVNRAQWLSGRCDDWRTLCRSPWLEVICEYVEANCYDPADRWAEISTSGERFRAAVEHLPATADRGQWPELVERPATVER